MGHFQKIKVRGLELVYIYDECFEYIETWRRGPFYFFLDDAVFNKKKVGHFEFIMRSQLHSYFFSKKGEKHYDQFEVFKDKKRFIGSGIYELDLRECFLETLKVNTFPFHNRALAKRGLMGDFLQNGKALSFQIACFEQWVSDEK